MTTTTPHTRAAPPPHRTRSWWLLLAFTAVISLTFNIWYAIDPPTIATTSANAAKLALEAKNRNGVLGVMTGVIPVVLAAWLSHEFEAHLLGKWGRAVIIAVFVGAMAMSIVHQAALLEANLGPVWCWALPAMVDAVALLALRAIVVAHRLNREAAEAADMERDMAALEDALRPKVAAEIHARLEADMPRFRAELEADIRAELEADMARQLAAKEAAIESAKEADIEARLSAMLPDMEADIERRVRREMSGRGKTARAAIAPGKSGAKPDLTSEEQEALARQLLEQDPDMSGAELGRRLNKSPRHGSRLRNAILGLSPDMADAEEQDMADGSPGSMSDGGPVMSDGSQGEMADSRARLRAV